MTAQLIWCVNRTLASSPSFLSLSRQSYPFQSSIMMSPQRHTLRIKQSLPPPPMHLLLPSTLLLPPLINWPPSSMPPFLLQPSLVIPEPGISFSIQSIILRLLVLLLLAFLLCALLSPLSRCFTLSWRHRLAAASPHDF
jgi:hypothetical protein